MKSGESREEEKPAPTPLSHPCSVPYPLLLPSLPPSPTFLCVRAPLHPRLCVLWVQVPRQVLWQALPQALISLGCMWL